MHLANNLNDVVKFLNKFLNLGYSLDLAQNLYYDSIDIRIIGKHPNSFQIINVPTHNFYYKMNSIQLAESILDFLVLSTNGVFYVYPKYIRNFNKLMDQILESEFKPGVL